MHQFPSIRLHSQVDHLLGTPGRRVAGGMRVYTYDDVTPDTVEALTNFCAIFDALAYKSADQREQRAKDISARWLFRPDSYFTLTPSSAGPNSNARLNSLSGTTHGRAS